MKTMYDILEKLIHSDRGLLADMLLAFLVAIAFTGFAVTVMQMDRLANFPLLFPPGKIVYM